MRKISIVLIVFLFLFIPLWTLYKARWTSVSTPVSVTCQEDEDCWDCATMGNGVCGSDTAVDVYLKAYLNRER